MLTRVVVVIGLTLMLSLQIFCTRSTEKSDAIIFDEAFFNQYVPEFPGSRLLTLQDLPKEQQQFFEEAGGKLQASVDFNENGINEYIICGISEPVRQDVESYFIAVFERDGQGIRRLFFQKLFVPPVSIRTSEEGLKEKSVMIAFGFYSDYGATLVYRNGKYELEVWEPSAA